MRIGEVIDIGGLVGGEELITVAGCSREGRSHESAHRAPHFESEDGARLSIQKANVQGCEWKQ